MERLGVTKICPCGKCFRCSDGDYFCSDECYDRYEQIYEEDELENE